MASAAFSIGGGSSLAMYEAAAAEVVTIALDSVDGVRVSNVVVVSTDELTVAADWVIAAASATSTTVTCPLATGAACILQWTVNGGATYDSTTGQPSTGDLVKTAKIGIPTADGFHVIATGETYESDGTYGWSGLVNDFIRNGGGGGGGGGLSNPQALTNQVWNESAKSTYNATTELEANTALLDVNATTLTADGTTATVTYPTTTITANTKATIASTTEVEVNTGLLDLNPTTTTLDGTTLTVTVPTSTLTADTKLRLDSAVEVESNTALLDLNATATTLDGTTCVVTVPTTTVTANTKLTLASTTEVEVNCGVCDVNAASCTLDTSGAFTLAALGAIDVSGASIQIVSSDGRIELDTTIVGGAGNPVFQQDLVTLAYAEAHGVSAAWRTWTANQGAAQSWVDIGAVFAIAASTTVYYEMAVLETQPGYSSSGGEGSLTAPASSAMATVEFAVTRNGTTGITISQRNGVANTTGWAIGKVTNSIGVPAFVGTEIRAVDDGAGGWKLQQRVGNTQAASSTSTLEGTAAVRLLATEAWSSSTTRYFGEAICNETCGTSWTMNTAAAAIYAPSTRIGLGSGNESIVISDSGNKCSVAWRSNTDALGLTIEADQTDTNITAVGTLDILSGGNCTVGVTGTLGITASSTCSMSGTTVTLTGNTKARLDSTTEVEINCGLFDVNATGAVTVDTTSASITLTTTTSGDINLAGVAEVDITSATLDLNQSGAATWDAASVAVTTTGNATISATNTLTLNGSNDAALKATGAGSDLLLQAGRNGKIGVAATASLQFFGEFGLTTMRGAFRMPADVATTDATANAAAWILTPSASRPTTYLVFIMAENAAGEAKAWVDYLHVTGQSGSAAFMNGAAPTAGTTSTKTHANVSAATLAYAVSTTTVLVRGTGIAATNLTWSLFVWEIL